MHFTATGHRSRYFELYNDRGQPLGQLDYAEWFSAKADATLADGSVYRMAPSGFWMTSMEMWQGDTVVARARRNWGMGVVIDIGDVQYHLKPEGLLNRHYALITDAGQEIAALRPNFSWREWSFSYEIETDDNYPEVANAATLLYLIYCINYMRRQAAAA